MMLNAETKNCQRLETHYSKLNLTVIDVVPGVERTDEELDVVEVVEVVVDVKDDDREEEADEREDTEEVVEAILV